MEILGLNMSILVYPLLTNFIRKLRGGSQPILARCSDGVLYVVKFANNLQGHNLLFNEAAGSFLYRACGLSVPEWKVIRVADSFLDSNPGCWFETESGRLRPEEGLCFGSRYQGEENTRLLEILPGSSLRRIENRACFWLAWLLDICAGHTDNRQAIFQEKGNGELRACFIDHGHMFGGPRGEQQAHELAARYLDPRVYEQVSMRYLESIPRRMKSLDAEKLSKKVQCLPGHWKSTSASEKFSTCIDRLSNDGLLGNMIHGMERCSNQAHGQNSAFDHHQCNSPMGGILRFGVQSTDGEHFAARRSVAAVGALR